MCKKQNSNLDVVLTCHKTGINTWLYIRGNKSLMCIHVIRKLLYFLEISCCLELSVSILLIPDNVCYHNCNYNESCEKKNRYFKIVLLKFQTTVEYDLGVERKIILKLRFNFIHIPHQKGTYITCITFFYVGVKL